MKTRSFYTSSNLHYWDQDYSPTRKASLWESCPILAINADPAVGHIFFDDFQEFRLAGTDIGWINTETGAGTELIGDAAGGVLILTNAVADNDSHELQWNGEQFKLATGKPLWFEARIKVNESIQHDLLIGLCITDTTLIDGHSDGVYFGKDDGDQNINFVTNKNTTPTSTDTTADLADDTWVRLGFFFDGAGSVFAYVNGVLKATHTTNIPDDEELAVSICTQAGEATNVKILSIDYVKVVQIR